LTKQPKGADRRPTAQEQAKVGYPLVRDRFLATSKDGDYVEWLIEVGRYVHHCWLAEEGVRKPGEPLDEDGLKPLWDGCSERELRTLRTEALVDLENYRQKKLGDDFLKVYLSLEAGWKVILWFLKTAVEGFVAGIGLIVLGLLLVLLQPHVAKSIRGALDDALPEATSPHNAGNGAPGAK
jgi:hypothetical protein